MAERFTDDEFAFLRHVRFGQLPPRIAPDDMVEQVDTVGPAYEPDNRVIESLHWFGSAGMP